MQGGGARDVGCPMRGSKPHEATEVERRQLKFACRFCGADIGRWCHVRGSRTARRAPFLHATRLADAHNAGALPLRDVDVDVDAIPVSAVGEAICVACGAPGASVRGAHDGELRCDDCTTMKKTQIGGAS